MLVSSIDLNCDLGESTGYCTIGQDADVMPLISSANIACGMHGGDPLVMHKTVRMAAGFGVAIGAHPSYHDKEGFGRREMKLSPQEIYDLMLYQLGALEAMTRVEGMRLHHVKPHGALYNRAVKDAGAAEAVVDAVSRYDSNLYLYGPTGSQMEMWAMKKGIKFTREVFADRRYAADGSLVPRTQAGSVISDPSEVVQQVESILLQGRVRCLDGTDIAMEGETICIHGDGEHALSFVHAIRAFLHQQGISILTPP